MNTTSRYLSKYLFHPRAALEEIKELEMQAGQFREVLMEQQYYWLWQRIKPHTTLMDFGTNIGDTTAYFAMHPNVEKVITYEIDERLKWKAQELLAKMPTPLHLKIEFRDGIFPKMLEAELKGKHNVAIKCDIEEADKHLFEFASLKNVYAIQMEYHDSLRENISSLKRNGFNTSFKRTAGKEKEYRDRGYIYAERMERVNL